MPVSEEIKFGSNVCVETTSDTIRVGIKAGDAVWNFLIDGRLNSKIKSDEVLLSLESVKHISLMINMLKL